jgi:hypothetical protein
VAAVGLSGGAAALPPSAVLRGASIASRSPPTPPHPARPGASRTLQPVSPFWIWMQALIVLCVVASVIIATIKLV